MAVLDPLQTTVLSMYVVCSYSTYLGVHATPHTPTNESIIALFTDFYVRTYAYTIPRYFTILQLFYAAYTTVCSGTYSYLLSAMQKGRFYAPSLLMVHGRWKERAKKKRTGPGSGK